MYLKSKVQKRAQALRIIFKISNDFSIRKVSNKVLFFCETILIHIFTLIVTEWRTKFRRAMNETDNAQRTKAVDSLLNFETVKYFNAESYEVCCYKKCILEYQKCEWQSMASLNLMNFIQNFVNNAGLLTGSILAALMVSEGTKTVGTDNIFS